MLLDLVFIIFPILGFIIGVIRIKRVSLFVIICVGVFSLFLLFGIWFGSRIVLISFFFLVVGGIICVFAYVSSFSYRYAISRFPTALIFFVTFSPLIMFLFDWNFSFFFSNIGSSWELSISVAIARVLILRLVVVSIGSFLFKSYGSVRPSSI